MNKTYKIQLPRNKEAQNIKTNIKDGTIEVDVELNEKWAPKDGEICYARTSSKKQKFIIIYNHQEYSLECGVFNKDKWSLHKYGDWVYSYLRPATDSEKQLLFDALAKEGKMWDAERKQVVDLPKQAVEPPRRGWEPKDGDVCFISAKHNHLIIFRKFENDVVKSYVNMTSHGGASSDSRMSNGVCYVNDIVEFRPATDWERMYFFDCMAKEGKAWDAENRKVVDYPKWNTRKGGKDESKN